MGTFVSFLLDETGSMETIKDDTIGGFNQYVSSLKNDIEGNCYFTLVKFDSSHETVVCEGVEPAEVPRLTEDNYRPGAMTPLVDAIFNIVKKTEALVKDKSMGTNNVVIVVQTDGKENRSVKNTSEQLKELITGKEKDGWAFTFIGAGIDAFAEAGKFGFSKGATMSYAMGASMDAFDGIAGNTLNYANKGLKGSASMAFSASQRSAAGEDEALAVLEDDGGSVLDRAVRKAMERKVKVGGVDEVLEKKVKAKEAKARQDLEDAKVGM